MSSEFLFINTRCYGVLFCSLVLFSFDVSALTLPDFAPLVENNAAAVVNISTILKKSEYGERGPHGFNMPDIPEDSPFYEFFKKYFDEMPEGMEPFKHRSSLGSGFVISSDGYVITNNHVVKDADEVIVRLNDRREFIAELVGTDERSDIAVLKVEGSDLPTVKLGNSSDLKVGEWVLAIGSPFGFDHSVTAGIVSAMGRSLPNENYVPFIQTDVAINPGNSGGPLFNLQGEVVGVNSQIYSRTGGFMGLSFAVPINVVTNVYQQIRDQGHVSRGWLGVLIQDVTRELAESFGMERPHGALIAKVLPDSPATAAGLEVGDIVIRFNGEEVSFSSDLPPMVGNSMIGKSVPVDIIRRGKEQTVSITIAELPGEEEIKIAGAGSSAVIANALNIAVNDIDEQQRKELGIEDYGVIVSGVSEGPATKAGIIKGDVILLINNIKVKDAGHFNEIVESLPEGKSIPVLIQRSGGPIFLALKLKDAD